MHDYKIKKKWKSHTHWSTYKEASALVVHIFRWREVLKVIQIKKEKLRVLNYEDISCEGRAYFLQTSIEVQLLTPFIICDSTLVNIPTHVF